MASRCAYSNRQLCHLLPQRRWWARLLPRQRLSLLDYLNSLYICHVKSWYFTGFNYQTYQYVFQQNLPGKLEVYCILANINRETLSSTNWMSHKCKQTFNQPKPVPQVRKRSNKAKGANSNLGNVAATRPRYLRTEDLGPYWTWPAWAASVHISLRDHRERSIYNYEEHSRDAVFNAL